MAKSSFKFKAKVRGITFRFRISMDAKSIKISGPPRGKRGEKKGQAFLKELARFTRNHITGGPEYRGRAGKKYRKLSGAF